MKFTTRMFLFAALISVSFMAGASPPTLATSEIEITATASTRTSTAALNAIQPTAYRGEDLISNQAWGGHGRLLGGSGSWKPMYVSSYRPPQLAVNSGIGRRIQHRM